MIKLNKKYLINTLILQDGRNTYNYLYKNKDMIIYS